MNILRQNKLKILFFSLLIQVLVLIPVYALDFDTTVNDSSRKNYTNEKPQVQKRTVIQAKQESENIVAPQSSSVKIQSANTLQEKQPLSTVPAIPKQTNSTTVAPINTIYSGKMPNSEALIPCTDIKRGELIIDSKYANSTRNSVITHIKKNDIKKKTTSSTPTISAANYNKYRYTTLAKGTQVRVINVSKLSDGMYQGQTVIFKTTQDIYTTRTKIPAGTKLTVKIADSHLPQLSCNGGLIGLKVIAANINGYNQPMNAKVIKLKTDNIYFSNLKGEHTYWKTTCKKAKWGQKIFKKWSGSAKKLANKGPCIIIAPFPYVAGAATACASTISSPITALLGKGERIIVPAKTTFTIKLTEDAKIRY